MARKSIPRAPLGLEKKCGKRYKFQGENHRSSGATFIDMKTTKSWEHYVSRGFWRCAIWGKTLKLVKNGPQNSTKFWTPFISKVCIRVQVLRPFWEPFLTWNGKGVERNWASKHSGEVGSMQAYSFQAFSALVRFGPLWSALVRFGSLLQLQLKLQLTSNS